MLRKSLILGSITLLMVMLFALTGCEGPVGPAGPAGRGGENGIEGGPGPDGQPGGFAVGSSNVTDVELAAAFGRGDTVYLESSVLFVYGEVPAGKTLEVRGVPTQVTGGKALTVNGTLDVSNTKGTAALVATGIPGEIGVLKSGSAGVIKGSGMLILPYIVSGSYDAGLNYDSPEIQAVIHYPGSTVVVNDDPVALNSSGLRAIFNREEEALNELTVWDIKQLEAVGIPKGKKLTLKGPGNTIVSGFTLTDGASLTISQGAVLHAPVGLSVTDVGTVITNEGTIKLDATGSAKRGATAGDFINDGVIESSSTSPSTIEGLLALGGTGNVILNPYLSTDPEVKLVGNSLLLNQNLIIEPDLMDPTVKRVYTLVFPDAEPLLNDNSAKDRTITLANEYASIEIGSRTKSTGIKIINRGLVVTKVAENPSVIIPDQVLVTLFEEMNNQGKIAAKGHINTLTQPLVIPEGIELIIDNATTNFEYIGGSGSVAGWPITVEGSLVIRQAADPFEPDGDLTVTGTLVIGSGQRVLPGGDVTITGTLDLSAGTGGSLYVTGGKDLSISSTSVLEKTLVAGVPTLVTGQIFMLAADNGITIDGVPGYGTRSLGSGIVGSNFAKALKAVHDSADILKANLITLESSSNSPFFGSSTTTVPSVDVVGTVDLTAGGSADVDRDTDAENHYLTKITFPIDVEIAISVAGDDLASNYNPAIGNLGDAPDFIISLSGNALHILDDDYTAAPTGQEKWGIVAFEKVRFTHSNLVGPVRPTSPAPTSPGPWVDPFYVGIKTLRP
jgi:hypothetical protein